MAVPVLGVWIAFDDGAYEPNPSWVNVSSDVRNVSIHRTRDNDFSEDFVSTASVVLDNNLRVYDPFNFDSIYANKLTPRRQIKIEGTANGTAYTIFRGYISGFPVNFSKLGKDSTITIDCFDLLSLLAAENLKSDLADIYTRSLSPRHYYKCNDPDGSTTIKDYGSAAIDLSVHASFTGKNLVSHPNLAMGLSGNAADLSSTAYRYLQIATATTGNATICFWGAFSDRDFIDRAVTISADSDYLSLSPNTPNKGQMFADVFNGTTGSVESTLTNTTTVVPSHYALTYDSSSGVVTLYINGVDRSTNKVNRTGAVLFPTDSVYLTGGIFQEVAFFDTILTATEISNLYQFGQGFQQETSNTRISRLLALTDVPAGRYEVHTSPSGTIKGVPLPDAPVVDSLREVMRTEGGFLFTNREGKLKTTNRLYFQTNSTSSTSQATITDSSGAGTLFGYTDDIDIFLDGDLIRNEIVVNNAFGAQVTQSDPTSISQFGVHTETVDAQCSDDAGSTALATHLLTYYKIVVPSVSPIEVGLPATTDAQWQILLQLDLLDRVSFTRTPAVGTVFAQDMLLNSIEYDLSPKVWKMKIAGSSRFAMQPPTCSILAASAVTGSTATLNGKVSANYFSTTINFQYSQDPTFATYSTIAATPATTTLQSQTVYANVTGLDFGYTYYCRLVASNTNGTTTSGSVNFLTSSGAPAVVASAVSSLTDTSVTLNGTVDANGASSAVTFQYSTDSGFSTFTEVSASPSTVTANTPTAVSVGLTGLTAGTTYYWRIKAVNSAGTTTVNGSPFVPVGLPAVTLNATTNFSQALATFNANINWKGGSTSVTFEYSSDSGSTWSSPVAGNTTVTNSSTNVYANVSGLTANTDYIVRVKATNSAGTTTVQNSNGNFKTWAFQTFDKSTAGTWNFTIPTVTPTGGSAVQAYLYFGMFFGGGAGANGSGGGGGASQQDTSARAVTGGISVVVGAGGAADANGGATSISGWNGGSLPAGNLSVAGGSVGSDALVLGVAGTSGNSNAGGTNTGSIDKGSAEIGFAGGGGGGAGGVGGNASVDGTNKHIAGNGGTGVTISQFAVSRSGGAGGGGFAYYTGAYNGDAPAQQGSRGSLNTYGSGGNATSRSGGGAGQDGMAYFSYYASTSLA
jgi:hypothetical protein